MHNFFAHEPSFPTRIFSAYSKSMNNPKKKQYNIGVIEVQLKNWTEKPINLIKTKKFYLPLVRSTHLSVNNTNTTQNNFPQNFPIVESQFLNEKINYDYSETRLRRKNNKRNITATKTSFEILDKNEGDTFAEIVAALWKRVDLFNSPLGYMIIAASFMLVAFLAIIYAILTIALNKRKQRNKDNYEEIHLVVANNNAKSKNGLQKKYATKQLNDFFINRQLPNQFNTHYNFRQPTPKNSLNSLSQHYVEKNLDSKQLSETEIEKLYRCVKPYYKYPLNAPAIKTPLLSNEKSSSMHKYRSNEHGKNSKEKRLKFSSKILIPPPPPNLPPPPVPSNF